MLVLGLDTATTVLSVAVWRDDALLAVRTSDLRRGQSEVLMPLLAEALAEAGVGYAEVEALGVVTGPGSFTGLRLGLAAAKGLAMGLAKPLYGFDTFTVLRAAHGAAVVPVVESWRDELFVEFTAGQTEMLPPDAVRARLPAGAVVVGDGAARLGLPLLTQPLAPVVAALAGAALRQGAVPVCEAAYMRPPDVTVPLP